jgi:hypothetical protein
MSRPAQVTGNVRVQACPDRQPGITSENLTVNAAGQPSGEIATAIYPFIPQPPLVPTTAIPLPPIKTNITLPRPGDQPDDRGNFHYALAADALDNSIQLTDGQSLNVRLATDQNVNIYASGNIDLGGSQVTVQVTSDRRSHPDKLRIYGSDRTRKFSIKDSASVAAFIHAPQAEGWGWSSPQIGNGITGGLWLHSWDSDTHNSKLPIQQQGSWHSLGIASADQLGWRLRPLRSWQRPAQP